MLILFLDLIDSIEGKDNFIYLYKTYNSYLYNYILKMVKDSYAAQDILQEVFFRAAKNIHKVVFLMNIN